MSDRDVVADLHVHTTASDGTLTLEEVHEVSRDIGLAAVGITDHDRIHPDIDGPVEIRDGVTIVRGIELKVKRATGNHVDLLGYGVRESERLGSLTRRLQTDRLERARRMRDRLEAHLDVQLDLDVEYGIGRPHIARAVADVTGIEVQTVFDEYIGEGRPCHVSRSIPTYADVLDVLESAASVVALAHPLRYDHLEEALEIAIELGAVERWYPYDTPVDETALVDTIGRHDLLATGGSDAHDADVGRIGLDASAWESVEKSLGIDR